MRIFFYQTVGLLEIQKQLHLLRFIEHYLKGSVAWPRASEAHFMLQPAKELTLGFP